MTDFILWVQSASNQFLDTVFWGITNLGSPLVLALVAIVVYWCFDKYRGVNLALILSTSVVLNTGLKELFRIPRPYTYHPDINQLDRITGVGWSFPSGHAQLTASATTGLYLNIPKRILAVLAVVIPVLVAFSRIYLGVHTPVDVVCGIVIGAAWAWLVFTLVQKITARRKNGLLLLFCVPQIILSRFLPQHDLIRMAGLSLGFVVGFLLDEKYLQFSPASHIGLKLFNLLVGGAITGAVKLICGAIFPSAALFVAAQYFALGATITLLCPWVFCVINAKIRIK